LAQDDQDDARIKECEQEFFEMVSHLSCIEISVALCLCRGFLTLDFATAGWCFNAKRGRSGGVDAFIICKITPHIRLTSF
jgi:hypothetical protein